MDLSYRPVLRKRLLALIALASLTVMWRMSYGQAGPTTSAPIVVNRPAVSRPVKVDEQTVISFQRDALALRGHPASLVSVLRGPPLQLEQVVPPGDSGTSQGSTLSMIGLEVGMTRTELAAALAGTNANRATACSPDLVTSLSAAQRAVDLLPNQSTGTGGSILADERLRRLLVNAPGTKESSAAIAALRTLQKAWTDVLANCFAPPSADPLFEKLKTRVGALYTGQDQAFCAGILVADGTLLTARHCAFDPDSGSLRTSQLQGAYFLLSDGLTRLSIGSPDIGPNAPKSFSADADELTLAVAKTGAILPPLARAAKVTAFDDSKDAWKQVTELSLFTVVPLARVIDPAKYSSSVLAYTLPGCFVVHQSDTCITHMCGAVPGTSGASLFLKNVVDPTWVAVHVGSETDAQSCTRFGSSISTNIANRKLDAASEKFFK